MSSAALCSAGTEQNGVNTERWFRTSAAISSQSLNQGELALAEGYIHAAEHCALAALSARPELFKAYHLLGLVQEAKGNLADAGKCYRGELPDSIGKAWFGGAVSSHGRASGTAPVVVGGNEEAQYNRLRVHAPESMRFTAPESATRLPRPEFGRADYESNPTWVDQVECGVVWHDAHNTLVVDQNGCELSEHSVGNPSLVRSLAEACEPCYLGKRAILLGARGGGNYYHWLTDILPKIELLGKSGIQFGKEDVFVLTSAQASFQFETLQTLGITRNQLFLTRESTPWFTADEVCVPFLQNKMALKMGNWLPEYLRDIFDTGDVTASDASVRNKIFVARDPKKKGSRLLNNYNRTVKHFEQYGFEIVFPENHSVSEQARIFAGAGVVAAPHGAGLANIVFCKPGTEIIEFYGDHIAPCYWAICNLLGLRYRQVDCRQSTNDLTDDTASARTLAQRRVQGFEISAEVLEQVLSDVA